MSPAQQLAYWQQILETLPTPPKTKPPKTKESTSTEVNTTTQTTKTQTTKRKIETEAQRPDNWESLSKKQKCNWKKNHK